MEMTYPVSGENFKSTSAFGMRNNAKHKGIDLKADSGDRIVAALPGVVIKSDDTTDPQGYGGQILIKHDIDGKIFYTRYAHLRKRYVVANETVSQGEKIGEAGGGENDPNKGRATGPHLHFELLDYGQKPIDPEPYLKGALIGGAAALAASTDKDSGKKPEDDGSSNSEGNVVDKIMRGFMKGYTPIANLASLKGLSEPQKESEIPKPILEDIERIKQLLK
jgi:Peptidase family M23